jgi:hypothetical protein
LSLPIPTHIMYIQTLPYYACSSIYCAWCCCCCSAVSTATAALTVALHCVSTYIVRGGLTSGFEFCLARFLSVNLAVGVFSQGTRVRYQQGTAARSNRSRAEASAGCNSSTNSRRAGLQLVLQQEQQCVAPPLQLVAMPRFWTPQSGVQERVERPTAPSVTQADSTVAETRVTKTPAKGRPPTAAQSGARGRASAASIALQDDRQGSKAARSTSVPASGQKSRAAQARAIVNIINSTPMSAKKQVQPQPSSTQKRSKTPAKTPARYRAGAMEPDYTSENDAFQSAQHADRAAVFKSSMKIRRTPPQQLPPTAAEAAATAVAVPVGGAVASAAGLAGAATVSKHSDGDDNTTTCTAVTALCNSKEAHSCNSSVQVQCKTVHAAVADVQVKSTVLNAAAAAATACSNTDMSTIATTAAAAANDISSLVEASAVVLSHTHADVCNVAANDNSDKAAAVTLTDHDDTVKTVDSKPEIVIDENMQTDNAVSEQQANEQQQQSAAVELISSVKHDKPFARSEKLSRTPTSTVATATTDTIDTAVQLADAGMQHSAVNNNSSSSTEDVSKSVPVAAQQQKRLSLQAAVDHHHERQYNITAQEVAKLRSDLASATQREAVLVKQQKDLTKKVKHAEKHALSLGTQLSTVKMARARRDSIDTAAVSTATDAVVQQLQTTVQERLTGAIDSGSATVHTTAAAEYDRVLNALIKDVTVTTALCTNDELAMSERRLQVSILNDAVHIKKLNDELKLQHAAAINARAITSTVGNKLAAVLKDMAKKQYSKDEANQAKLAHAQAQVVQAANDNTVLQAVHTQQLSTAEQQHADEVIALKAVAQQEHDELQAQATAAATAAADAQLVASQLQAAEAARSKAIASVASIQTQTSAITTTTDTSDVSDDVSGTVEVAKTVTAAAKVKAATKAKTTKKVKKSTIADATITTEPASTIAAAAATAAVTADNESKATKKKNKKDKSKSVVNEVTVDTTRDDTASDATTTTDTTAADADTVEAVAAKASKKDKKHKNRKAALMTDNKDTTIDNESSSEMVVDTDTTKTAVSTKTDINGNSTTTAATEASVCSKQNTSNTNSRTRVQRSSQYIENAGKRKYVDSTDDDVSDTSDDDSEYECKATLTVTKHTSGTANNTTANRSGKGTKTSDVITTVAAAAVVKDKKVKSGSKSSDEHSTAAATTKASRKAATKSKSKAKKHADSDGLTAATTAATAADDEVNSSVDTSTAVTAAVDDAVVKQPKKKRARKQQAISDDVDDTGIAVTDAVVPTDDTATAATVGGRSKRKAATLAISKLMQESETDDQIDARLAYIAMKDKGITPTTTAATTDSATTTSNIAGIGSTAVATTAASTSATAAADTKATKATAKTTAAKTTSRKSAKQLVSYADESSDDSSSNDSSDDDDYNDSDTEFTSTTTSTTNTSKKSKGNSGAAVVKPKKQPKADTKASTKKVKQTTAAAKAVNKRKSAASAMIDSDSDTETITTDTIAADATSAVKQPVPLMDRLVQRMNANNTNADSNDGTQQTVNMFAALTSVQQQHSTDDNDTENHDATAQPKAAVAAKPTANKKATATTATATVSARPVVANLVKKRKLGNSSTYNTGTLLGSLMNPKAGFKIPKLKAKV